MRITSPANVERFGSVRIHSLQHVLELDSGGIRTKTVKKTVGIRQINESALADFGNKLAIVVPIKDEKIKLYEGVLRGIPHNCLIIVVSNSKREPIDRYEIENDVLQHHSELTDHEAVIVHQKAPIIAEAFKKSGYKSFLDKDGIIRNGKAEGMIIGIMLAKLFKRKYVGFIDADNYVPGSVCEYIKEFIAGLYFGRSPYVIVRLNWRYKPKFIPEPYFRRWGRVSEYSNRFINKLISSYTGFETEIVKTTCAGEHAMSLNLAELITFGPNYAVETQELVSIFEEYGGILPPKFEDVATKGIDIFQIETVSPHFHEDKGSAHLSNMVKESLSAIYYSRICKRKLKGQILEELRTRKVLKKEEKMPVPQIMPPLRLLNYRRFSTTLRNKIVTYGI